MASTATTTRRPRKLNARRIIERPRLLAVLDQSTARVRTLVAPPGYGKTTLAEQWVGRDGRRHAWFTARRSATDVAALAVGLARASTTLAPDCDERLREHLRAVPSSADNVDLLAEILAEDFAAWPSDGWLVLDDYHEVARGVEAERFVEQLVALSPVQLLLASRVRPSWVTTRRIMYGEVLEVNQTALAMDADEAAAVLPDSTATSASGLVTLANGWPAVIGLAAVSGADMRGDVTEVPESLYRFFAEEVYSSLGSEIQSGLVTLSCAPLLDRELAVSLLGDHAAQATCAAALGIGILAERGARLELHPLCRTFLEERSAEIGFVASEHDVHRCLEHYLARGEWDAAFDVVTRFELTAQLTCLVSRALEDLLESARLQTAREWCALASDLDLDDPIFAIARAEIALRQGRHTEAQTHAEVAAASQSNEHVFRGLCLAGRAAHLASREEEGLALYRRAEAAATTERERRDALWGQFICAGDLERSDLTAAITNALGTHRHSEPREIVRASAYLLSHQLKSGSIDLAAADSAVELVEDLADPLVVSSFESAYSVALGLAGRYADARDVAEALLRTVERYRLEFALPYAYCSLALASAGLRDWERATQALGEASRLAARGRNAHALQLAYSLNLRVLAQRGRPHAALVLEPPQLAGALPGAAAEVIGSRALVMALAGRLDEAEALVASARGNTQALEPVCLAALVDALLALKRRAPAAMDAVMELERVTFSSGAVDLLVTGYRSSPELLLTLLRGASDKDRFAALVRRVGDDDLTSAVGCPLPDADDLRSRLSPREREVYELLLQPLTNRQIADILFISVLTVKVHVHKIYDKLGVRSRTALALQAALERSGRQATSETTWRGSDDDS